VSRPEANRDLSPRRVTLAIAVDHFERDLVNVQRLQCPRSIPCWNCGHLIRCASVWDNMNQLRRNTNRLNVISVSASLPSGPCSVTVRLHVTGMQSSIAFFPRLHIGLVLSSDTLGCSCRRCAFSLNNGQCSEHRQLQSRTDQ
jgi:hypothetical protein